MKKSIQYISAVFSLIILVKYSAIAQSSYKDNSTPKKVRATDSTKSNFFSQGKGDTLPVNLVKEQNNLTQGKLSLRNDFPYEQAPYEQSKALSYPKIRQEDIGYSVRIWEDVDTRNVANRSMMYAINDLGSQQLISVILKAVNANQVTAFSSIDDRFTTPITPAQVKEAMGNGLDTSATYDLDGNVSGYQVRTKVIDLDSIYKFRLKEDWFYDKNYGKIIKRIIGIAPVVTYVLSTGDIIPNSEHALFWIYFPDLRSILTKYKAFDMRNMGTKIPFDELFDVRDFKAKIVKSNYKNPGEIPWNTLMPNEKDQDQTIKEIKARLKKYGREQYEMISQDIQPKK